jgi:hypothetical protein
MVPAGRPPATSMPAARRAGDRSGRARPDRRRTDLPAVLSIAAAAQNKAALIASDCGLTNLARSRHANEATWCWCQFDAYLRALPWGARVAQHALEPLVNPIEGIVLGSLRAPTLARGPGGVGVRRCSHGSIGPLRATGKGRR